MFDLEKWDEIIYNVKRNKLRTFLTSFSVFWGILLLVILLGLGRGLENGIKRNFSGTEKNIWLGGGVTKTIYKGYDIGRQIQLTNDDLIKISGKLDGVDNVSSQFLINEQEIIFSEDKSERAAIYAIHPDYQNINGISLVLGRMLNYNDTKECEKVALIGTDNRDRLFGNQYPIGKYITIRNLNYKIVGVYTSVDENSRNRLYIPLSTGQALYSRNNNIDMVVFSVNNPSVGKSNTILENLKRILSRNHNFNVSDDSAIWHQNSIEEYDKYESVFKIINIFIWIVGLGSLLSGIMGVSNISLIVVKERTHEIGIRKAIGATPFSVISMILTESIIIMMVAGYLGLITGLLIINKISGSPSEFIYNPNVDFKIALIATFILIISGALAGYIPARKAAAIKPIVALREE